ncbi:MAG: lipoprotein-releasing ABC transporter permease subunit [Candidatus Nitrotoga sp.]|nr:lipoprotein-releasing ABC transporter permease subunit [Candidatus Nitrotoga sp.]MBP0117491.1 lipoprotein-releasing ABC transporter permease subunit [Candidatus Nitrotoga sp.]MBP0123332.1 lipoprotein-releasing ABC transporter permease subunit [Candidatus Nitrotoga sp.]MBP0125350.1 lipoprotein-releasing ABC transporter permease subunit [Candidatus Nitrotoga sp.]
MRPYELFIALRYTRTKRRNHFISFISLISMLGMALGVCALIVVLSVMNGFQKEIRTRILGIAPHLQINAESNDLVDWQPTLQVIKSHPQVVAAAPFINGQGMISFDQNVQGVMVRGILPQDEKRVIDISNKMKSGSLNDLQADGFGIALGSDLARSLGAHVGDKVLLISPQGQVTPAGMMPRLKQFHVAAIFEIGMAPYDNALALIHLSDAQRLYRMDGTVSGISARLHDLDLAPQVSAEIGRSLPRNTYVSDWTRQHANYFRAVQIEKKMMFIILSLIVAVAAFNIVSTMVMAVTDKRADIAILRTLGATPASIMRIFIVQGVIIGLVGSVLGVAGGILLTLNIDTVVPFIEKLVGMHFLSKEVYFITELPSDLQCNDVLIVAGFSFLISLLATIYPSWRASKVQPAEALRYE